MDTGQNYSVLLHSHFSHKHKIASSLQSRGDFCMDAVRLPGGKGGRYPLFACRSLFTKLIGKRLHLLPGTPCDAPCIVHPAKAARIKMPFEVTQKVRELKIDFSTKQRRFGGIFPLIFTDNGGSSLTCLLLTPTLMEKEMSVFFSAIQTAITKSHTLRKTTRCSATLYPKAYPLTISHKIPSI